MKETMRRNILILDPERDIGELFARALERRRDCKCYLAIKEEEALDLMGDISFDLLLVDIGTVMNADFSFLKKIRRLFPSTTIIIDAYLHQKDLILRGLAAGANGYFIKPIQIDSFRKKIDEFYALKAASLL
jgi:DNA-binding response OmpR family regulator